MKFNYYFCKSKIAAIVLSTLASIALLSSCAAETPYSETAFALNTACTITVGEADDTAAAIGGAFEIVYDIQSKIDYYDPNSVVSKFNSAPAWEAVELDADTFEIVRTALEVSRASGGAFDITVAPVKDLWDFKSAAPVLPDSYDIGSALSYVGYEKLILDTEARTLTKTEDGVKIDLGGCGKGYSCQKAAEYISENYPECYAILDFGGNVSVYGKNPRSSDGAFTAGIQEPFEAGGSYNQTVRLSSGESIVTSGIYQQYFESDGEIYHHIIDPSTGMPSRSGTASVSVIHQSSLTADCLSTACLVLGKERGTALAQEFGAQTIWIDLEE